jgi:hypothetical protein
MQPFPVALMRARDDRRSDEQVDAIHVASPTAVRAFMLLDRVARVSVERGIPHSSGRHQRSKSVQLGGKPAKMLRSSVSENRCGDRRQDPGAADIVATFDTCFKGRG